MKLMEPFENQNASAEEATALTPVPTPENEGFFGEVFRFALLALLIVIPIRWWVAQPFIVQGASMEPTFETNQYLIVDQLTYHLEDPKRGDIVIFKYPKDPSKFFIKRLIGLPSETVKISNHTVTVVNEAHPEGLMLNEPYIEAMHGGTEEVTLGPDEYFVMGDNRDASSDSRAWGVLPRKNIAGRAYLRLFPLDTIDILPGHQSDTSYETR